MGEFLFGNRNYPDYMRQIVKFRTYQPFHINMAYIGPLGFIRRNLVQFKALFYMMFEMHEYMYDVSSLIVRANFEPVDWIHGYWGNAYDGGEELIVDELPGITLADYYAFQAYDGGEKALTMALKVQPRLRLTVNRLFADGRLHEITPELRERQYSLELCAQKWILQEEIW